MPPSSISLDRVRQTVAEMLEVRASSVERLTGSVANEDFVIRAANGQQLVLKAGPRAEIAAEAWASHRLSLLGVPVPDVIAVDLEPDRLGESFLILRFVTGAPSEDPGIVREVGRWFRRVHTVRLRGWGPLVVTGDPAEPASAQGRHHSWAEAIEAGLSGIDDLVVTGILDRELAAAARRLVAVDTLLGYPGPGVLLHNDLKAAHIFGLHEEKRDRLSAVIDWGDASVGDPAADLARLSMAGPAVTAAFLEGYGVSPTPELADRLARYRILWNIKALTYEYRAGGHWFDSYRDRIRTDTAALSP